MSFILVTDYTPCTRTSRWTIAREALLGPQRFFAVATVLPLNAASIRFQPLHPTPLALMPLPPRPWWRNRVEIKSRNVVMPNDASDEADPAVRGPGRSGFSRSGLVGGGGCMMLMDGLTLMDG